MPCWRHASLEDREHLLRQWARGECRDLFVGLAIDLQTVDEMLEAIDAVADGRFPDSNFGGCRFTEIDFSGRTFSGNLDLRGVRCVGAVTLSGCTIKGDLNVSRSWIGSIAVLDHVRIKGSFWAANSEWLGGIEGHQLRVGGRTNFEGALFREDALFFASEFAGHTNFHRCSFENATFSDAVFKDWVIFSFAKFDGHVGFNAAEFHDLTNMSWVTFRGYVEFDLMVCHGRFLLDGALFDESLDISRSVFNEAAEIGPTGSRNRASIKDSTFIQSAQIETVSPGLEIQSCNFRSGVNVAVAWGDIRIEDSQFGARSSVNHLTEHTNRLFGTLGPQGFVSPQSDAGRLAKYRSDARLPAVLTSLIDTDLTNLTISRLDLSMCMFARAHNLEALNIGPSCTFARKGAWFSTSRRRIFDEELISMADELRHYPDLEDDHRQYLIERFSQSRATVARTYRGLREALERHKDEPGAADFYFGEMECRRRDRNGPLGERALLFLYWLTCGYGLRATRACVALIATVSSLALLMREQGSSSGTMNFRDAAVLLARAGVGLSNSQFTSFELNRLGYGLEVAARVFVPVLLGLLALSVRGRVKR